MFFLANSLAPGRRPTPAVVHAGPLLMLRSDGTAALRRFLLRHHRPVVLVHSGHPCLGDAASDAGVTDVTVDEPPSAGEHAAAREAVSRAAPRLDFAIDAPGIRGPDGNVLARLTAGAALLLARTRRLRPGIRSKLLAGCAALGRGVHRVRIGHPDALASGRATVLLPDPGSTLGCPLPPAPEARLGAAA